MDFEWDETKRQSTLDERGLDFEVARSLFDGRSVVEVAARTTEPRTLTIGRLDDGKAYTVVWTWRGEVRRIISFRRAQDDEERRYQDGYGDHQDGGPQGSDRGGADDPRDR